jgi:ABC-2 type transport system ATP-binding protein
LSCNQTWERSDVEKELDRAAAAIHAALDAGDAGGALERLYLFAERYAVTRSLLHEVLLLPRGLGDTAAERRVALARARELIDEIAADHGAQGSAAQSAARARALLRARERVQMRRPVRAPVCVCLGLGKSFWRGGFRLAAVNLELRQGEITGVLGRNAGGKTTLLRILAGELRQDHGQLWYPFAGGAPGEPVDWVRVKAGIAYLPQELPRWYGSLLDNLHYEAALRGLRGSDNTDEVAFIVQRLGLQGHLEQRWSALSGGFKLRFSLARALLSQPQLLVLDEPLANLDCIAQQRLLSDLRDLADSYRQPLAVLLSSQHVHEVEAVADRLLFLREGEALYNGMAADAGAAREHSWFEFRAECDIHELRAALPGDAYPQLQQHGSGFEVRARLGISAGQLLRALLDAGIEPSSFRDLSHSLRPLFGDEA